MSSSLDGERMEMPSIEAQRPTLVPPTPYSIAPLGFDVRPSAPPPAAPKGAGVSAFVGGTLFGGLMMAVVVLAWRTTHPAETVVAAAQPVPVLVAASAPVAAPSAVPAPVAAAVDSTSPSASATPDPASSPSAPKAKGVTHYHAAASHKTKETKVAGMPSSASDDAFMKAIRASSH